MRLGLLSVLLPLALGCAGKNVVAGDEKTKAQQLDAALPSWCESACARIEACPQGGPCQCGADACDCPSPSSDCPAQCEQAMKQFTTGGDACAVVGENLRKCIDAASCSALQGNACMPSAADQAACPAAAPSSDVPDPTGPATTGSGGGASTGDSSGAGAAYPSYPSGTAGSAAGGGAPAGGSSAAGGGAPAGGSGAVVSCQSAYGTAGANSGGGPPSSAVVCEEGVADCTDNHEYTWLCAIGSEGQTACSCLVDSHATGAFDPGGTSCPTQAQVNAGCGWNIAQ